MIQRYLIITLITFCSFPLQAQTSKTIEINTASANKYIVLAEKIANGTAIENSEWDSFFRLPPYNMMLAGGAIDTASFKAVMQKVYSTNLEVIDTAFKYRYHSKYKQHLPKIKQYLEKVSRPEFHKNIKTIVYKHLPTRLHGQIDELQFFYTVYGVEESTGMAGMVINDALFTYQADNFAPGLISAHEAIHAIVSKSFQQKLVSNIDFNDQEFAILYCLQTIAEEGIADLIDKKTLSSKGSPMRDRTTQLIKDDDKLGKFYIKRMDSLFSALADDKPAALKQFPNISFIYNHLGKNGGHIPGRYMVSIIQKHGQLTDLIDHIDNPYHLLLAYQKATKDRSEYVQISDTAIKYAQSLTTKFFK